MSSTQNVEKRGEYTITYKTVEMPEEMLTRIVDMAIYVLEKYNIEKDMASALERELNREFSPSWHVIIGKNFGFYGTHESERLCYFIIGTMQYLCFKSR